MSTTGAATHEADQKRSSGWWTRPFQTFQTNLREIDADLDVERTLDFVRGQGCDTWLLNTGGILSWYPTDLPFQERNPHLSMRRSGDLIGDATTAAAARGVRVLSRMDFSKVVPRIAEEHPEWCFVSPSGERQEYEGLISVCPNGDYYQQRLVEVLDDVLARYEIAGFFCNWLGFNEVDYARTYHGVCHCQRCVQRYASEVGEPLPTGSESPGYSRWVGWTRSVIDELTASIRSHVHDRYPDVVLIQGSRSDVVFHEANNAIGRPLWPHATGESVSAIRSARPDAPILVNAVAFVDMPYRMAGEEPEHLGHYLAQAIARGANPSTYIMGPPGRIHYRGLAAAADISRFHARHADLYTTLEPAASIAVVRPLRHDSAAMAEFRGVYAALAERHVPFDVIALEDLAEVAAAGGFAARQAVLLPAVGELSAEVGAALDDYVETGGVVLTSGTSTRRDGGECLRTAPSTGTDGDAVVGFDLVSTYAADETGTMLPIHGSYQPRRWHEDARLVMALVPQAGYGPPEKAYGHAVSQVPVIAERQVGQGAHLQSAWSIGQTYLEVGTTDVRDAYVDLLLSQVPPLQVTLEGPEQVEVVLGRSGTDTVIHLLNYSGVRRSTFGPPVLVSGLQLRVRGAAGARADALVAGVRCVTADDGSDLIVDVPPITTFDVVAVKSGAPSDTPDQETAL